jgi:hypothetical protein
MWKTRLRCEDNIKMEIKLEDVDCIHLALGGNRWLTLLSCVFP